MKDYDLVVVGSGAGLIIVGEGLRRGLRCALIESDKMGGTCLNRGCIPSKILIQPADLICEAERGRRIGVRLRLEASDWERQARRMWSKIAMSEEIEKNLLQTENLDVFKGTGVFAGPYRMKVIKPNGLETAEFAGKTFVLATGARSVIPPLPGLEEAGYVTSETFFGSRFPSRPWKSLILIGGSIVAVEFAHALAAQGTHVTILEMLPRILSTEEPEISDLVLKCLRKRMDVRVNCRAVSVSRRDEAKIVNWQDTESGEKGDVAAEEILIAAGRTSNADILQVARAGLLTDAKGWIIVDKHLETSRPDIWAVGDALGGFQFRHKANYDAEICLRNMFAPQEKRVSVDYSAVPWAVYTYPQIGHVGLTEKEARKTGHDVLIAVKRYSSVAKGFAMGYEPGDEDDGLVKIVADGSRRILGVHVAGPEAAVLVQPFVYLMNAGFTCPQPAETEQARDPRSRQACPEAGTFSPILQSMIIHPSLSEVTGWALEDLHPSR